ncbi:hypothetical protein [Saccharolobus islandicus]|uniref:hypothetical protein n=1 Tax=Saccharolobus islandicus TaxID=43080 RepID=UPI00037B9F46|nr:hypothetical protein [Sulfolobus islandicus]
MLPTLGIAGLMTKLLDYWDYFEENSSKPEEFALYFLIGLIVQLVTLILVKLGSLMIREPPKFNPTL